MPNLTVAQAVQAFLADPKSFLEKNHLTIASNNKALAGVATFFMMDNGSSLGFTTGLSGLVGKKKKRQFFKVYWRSNGANAANADEFNAHYIPMLQTGNAQHYALPSAMVSPCDFMITSQLTGCSFALGSDGNGTRLVTHIQPNQNLVVGLRAGDLDNAVQGVFANDTLDFVHARQPGGYTGSSTVVGKRINGDWKLFIQNHGTIQSGKGKNVRTDPHLQKVFEVE